MKTIHVILALSLVCSANLTAQDYKAAKKALSKFENDRSNFDNLDEAVSYIQGLPEEKNYENPTYYLVKGMVMKELAEQVIRTYSAGIIRSEGWPNVEDPALVSYEALITAYYLLVADTKSNEKTFSSILNELEELQGIVYNGAVSFINDEEYLDAYEYCFAVIDIDAALSAQGIVTFLGVTVDRELLNFTYGFAAFNAGLVEPAANIFNDLRYNNFDNPYIYEALAEISQEKYPGDAADVIAEGLARYPDNVALLFAGINIDLRLGNLDALIPKLESALASEPTNTSVLASLANVYDNLYVRAEDEGDLDLANDYFNLAIDFHNQTLVIDPENSEAYYGIGAMLYNKAALLKNEISNLPSDGSPETLELETTLNTEVSSFFTQALPYFQKAESIEPNDIGTLTALTQIHLNFEEIELYQEFQRRLDIVNSGSLNPTSYYR